MTSIKIICLGIVCVVLQCGNAHAEYRKWTDTQGKTIEAEFVRMEIDKVVLQKQDGIEFKVPLASLSEHDQHYAMLLSPPRFEITVSPGVDQRTIGDLGNREYSYRLQYQIVQPSVTVRKSSAARYDLPLQMIVMLIGRDNENERYIILDRSSSRFTISQKNKNQYTFQCNPVDLQQVKGSVKMGLEYDGFVVAIRDQAGKLIGQKSNREDFQQHLETLLKLKPGTYLNDDMQPVVPKRPGRNRSRSLPGRWF